MKISPLLVYLMLLVLFSTSSHQVLAIEDPLGKPNNKFGIHILFPSEIDDASRLVNGNGGEWGYIVVPVQSGDRDLEKWQEFMDKARQRKLIPVIRLATEGDYFNTKVWRKPKESDILDFANFLDSLDWPVKNRYVSVFNEVNRDDEWGGKADPKGYAELLSYATTVFKSLSPDFFILSAGLDNASVNGNGAINKLTYMQRMNTAVPGVFNQIDGFVSHSYPNPSFSQPPSAQGVTSIASFRFERTLLKKMTPKKLPFFITETGWSGKSISDEVRAAYYKDAFDTVWSDQDIVMVSPFLLRAGGGPFAQFSFIGPDGTPTKQYSSIAGMVKTKGEPTQNDTPTPSPQVLGTEVAKTSNVPVLWFSSTKQQKKITRSEVATGLFHWMFGI
ncbi:MAG: hypothetical protein Q8Q49_00600 [bacterium]|nr:hypothetical protein [bacterium]